MLASLMFYQSRTKSKHNDFLLVTVRPYGRSFILKVVPEAELAAFLGSKCNRKKVIIILPLFFRSTLLEHLIS
jgi:hypothetical protein